MSGVVRVGTAFFIDLAAHAEGLPPLLGYLGAGLLLCELGRDPRPFRRNRRHPACVPNPTSGEPHGGITLPKRRRPLAWTTSIATGDGKRRLVFLADRSLGAGPCYDLRIPVDATQPTGKQRVTAIEVPMTTANEQYHIERAGLTAAARSRVIDEVRRCLKSILRHEGVELTMPDITFDLAGTSAGQYRRARRSRRDQHQLRFNPYLLARYLGEGLIATVPHEVAHYAVAVLYSGRLSRPHGREWHRIMGILGATPDVTHRHDLAGLPVRQQRRWRYRCACREHALSTTRHNRVQRGTSYLCLSCRQPLVPVVPVAPE